MTIIILDINTIPKTDIAPASRSADIDIDGLFWTVGGLPLTGNLQPILDNRESELLAAAQSKNQTFDIFDMRERKILKALVLLMLDEINILRSEARLPARTEAQLRASLKGKLPT